MVLKPQDVFILLKLVAQDARTWSYASAAHDLFMSVSEVHAGIKRAAAAGLIDLQTAEPIRKNLEEFLVHGAKYAFPPERGGLTRGIPTGYAAPPLNEIISRTDDPPPVWPHPEGNVRGYEFAPLYRSVPKAVASDHRLYELLALVDAIRDGRARERELAVKELKRRLKMSLGSIIDGLVFKENDVFRFHWNDLTSVVECPPFTSPPPNAGSKRRERPGHSVRESPVEKGGDSLPARDGAHPGLSHMHPAMVT